MPDETVIQVRVTPRTSRDEVAGWRDGVLAVRLRAPPVERQANDALRRFLADRLSIPLRDIDLISGATSRIKRLRISGLSLEEVRTRLGSNRS